MIKWHSFQATGGPETWYAHDIVISVERLKLMHTALVKADINEAYHQLYEACNGDMQERYRAAKVDPFKPFEHLWDVT